MAEYIAHNSPTRAAAMVERLLLAAEPLRQFPRMGRTVPEVGEGWLRELLVGDYRIIYRTAEDSVTVVTVIRGRRNLPPLLGRVSSLKP